MMGTEGGHNDFDYGPPPDEYAGITWKPIDLGPYLRGEVVRPEPTVGLTRKDDTLPARWFDEPITVGEYAGEKIDRGEFDAMLSRFYAISRLGEDGVPVPEFRDELVGMLGAR